MGPTVACSIFRCTGQIYIILAAFESLLIRQHNKTFISLHKYKILINIQINIQIKYNILYLSKILVFYNMKFHSVNFCNGNAKITSGVYVAACSGPYRTQIT